MADPNKLMAEMMNYDYENMEHKMIKMVDDILRDPELTQEKVKNSSVAAKAFLIWAQNIVDAKKTFDDIDEQPFTLGNEKIEDAVANKNEEEPEYAQPEEPAKVANLPE